MAKHTIIIDICDKCGGVREIDGIIEVTSKIQARIYNRCDCEFKDAVTKVWVDEFASTVEKLPIKKKHDHIKKKNPMILGLRNHYGKKRK